MTESWREVVKKKNDMLWEQLKIIRRQEEEIKRLRSAERDCGNAETWAVAQPWLNLAAKWQVILDRESPTSPMAQRAHEVLDYIHTQLARLHGR